MSKAASSPPKKKRRTEQQINVTGNSIIRKIGDGWELYFPPLDIRVTADTEDGLRPALLAALDDKTSNGTDEEKQAWQEFVQNNIIEVEITEDEYQHQRAEQRRQERFPANGLLQLTPETFDAAIASTTPTLVDFWAEWCQPCHAMAPALHELRDKLAGRLEVFGVDVEHHEALWERFDLKGVPTLIVFREGQEVRRILGTRSLNELVAELEPVLRNVP